MAESPLYVASRPFAWDFSGVFNDVVQRGQIGLQIGSSRRSSSSTSATKDFDYKGLAPWWQENYNAERSARSDLMGLLQEYNNDYAGAMADDRFMQGVSAIHQARNLPENERRGQQLAKMEKFEAQYKDRKGELVIRDGQPVVLPGSSGEPVTVGEYTEVGTHTPLGSKMVWEADATNSKEFETELEKTFSSLRHNEDKSPAISVEGISPDVGGAMNLFLNTTYGHKTNSRQLDDAVMEATRSIMDTRKNDILAMYMRTEDYKKKKGLPLDKGGFMNGKTIDPGAVNDAIFRPRPLNNPDGSPAMDEEGRRLQTPAGWWPEKLKEMAKKHYWVSNSETTSASAKTVSDQMKGLVGSQPFLDMFSGAFSSEGEGQRGYFFQQMGSGVKARTDNRSGYLLRDADKTLAINKKLQYSDKEGAPAFQPITENYDGAVRIPGLIFDDQGKKVNYFSPARSGFSAQASAPSNRFYIGTDVTKIPADKSLGEGSVTDKAMYHTFGKNGGVAIPVDELIASGAKFAMPDEVALKKAMVKTGAVEEAGYKGRPSSVGLGRATDVPMPTSYRHKTDVRILPSEIDSHSLVSAEEVFEDSDMLEKLNRAMGTSSRIATKRELEDAGMIIRDLNPNETKYFISPEAMIRVSAASAQNMELVPNTPQAKALAASVGGDLNKILNMKGYPQATAAEDNILQQSLR